MLPQISWVQKLVLLLLKHYSKALLLLLFIVCLQMVDRAGRAAQQMIMISKLLLSVRAAS